MVSLVDFSRSPIYRRTLGKRKVIDSPLAKAVFSGLSADEIAKLNIPTSLKGKHPLEWTYNEHALFLKHQKTGVNYANNQH